MKRGVHWFKLKFRCKCALCQQQMEEGDEACYDADKNILCKPCGDEEDDL